MMHITIDAIRNALDARTAVAASAAGAREAAVALTMAPDAGGRLSILFIKRAERAGDPWSGQMALPGGRRDRVDATLEDTARRETLEETGVDLLRGVRLGVLDDLRPQSRHLPPLVVRPYVFALTDQPPVTASDEVAFHLWEPVEGLLARRTEVSIELRGQTIVTPAYRVHDEIVWGMTERILTPFLERAVTGGNGR